MMYRFPVLPSVWRKSIPCGAAIARKRMGPGTTGVDAFAGSTVPDCLSAFATAADGISATIGALVVVRWGEAASRGRQPHTITTHTTRSAMIFLHMNSRVRDGPGRSSTHYPV